MPIHDTMLHCTAFVRSKESGLEGTGFFANVQVDDYDFGYFITAKHLLWPGYYKRGATPPRGDVYFRVNTDGGPPVDVPSKATDWIFHPDRFVDICALPFDPHASSDKNLDANMINLGPHRSYNPNEPPGHMASGLALRVELSLGEEVFIVGLFVGRQGETRNIPIVRIANVAALPVEPVEWASPRHPAYLIETRSLGGTSGAPVFLNPSMNRHGPPGGAVGPFGIIKDGVRDPAERMLVSYRLVGMVLGAHSGQYAGDFLPEGSKGTRRRQKPSKDAEFNAGISVVLPVKEIESFLHLPIMRDAREASLEERMKQSGYRSTSAPSPAEPELPTKTIEGDDQRKERFTALLDADVGKPKQGG